MAKKRKENVPLADDRKRMKLNSGVAAKITQESKKNKVSGGQVPGTSTTENLISTTSQPAAPNPRPRPRIRKLAPPRPFPTVAPSAPATAPRSLHKEGKNNICITRRTKLAVYLRRCKALILDDGFKEIRLSAMGAAIPHLALLAVSLPQMVAGDLSVEVQTGSVDVFDQMLEGSEDDDDDGDGDGDENGSNKDLKTRVKSTMNVIIRVGETINNSAKGSATNSGQTSSRKGNIQALGQPEQIILQEPEQDDMDHS